MVRKKGKGKRLPMAARRSLRNMQETAAAEGTNQSDTEEDSEPEEEEELIGNDNGKGNVQ